MKNEQPADSNANQVEEIENNLNKINAAKASTKNLLDGLSTVAAYNTEIENIETEIREIEEQTRKFDIIDYLDINKAKISLLNLKEINESLQDVKICMMEFPDDSAYKSRSVEMHRYLQRCGAKVVYDTMYTDVSLLYTNDDFAVFLSIIDEDLCSDIEIAYLKTRIVHCRKLVSHCIEDRYVFYRMMILQEMYLYSRIFNERFCAILGKLVKYDTVRKFSAFEKFILSLVKSFVLEMDEVSIGQYMDKLKSSIVEFKGGFDFTPEFVDNNEDLKDYFVDAMMYVCLKEVSGENDVIEI